MDDDLRKEHEREREREAQHIREMPEVMERLETELEKTVPAAEREQLSVEHEARMADPVFREQFDSLSEEEREAFCKDTLRVLEENREKLQRIDFSGQTVGEVIAELKEKQERMEKLQDETADWSYQLHGDLGEIGARKALQLVRWMQIVEAMTEEQWNALPVPDRTQLHDLVIKRGGGLREKCLSLLPIDLRRKLEE